MAIEQLQYTWAEVGLDGRGRLQPVAASRALHDRANPLLAQVVRLCRYDRTPRLSDPAATPSVSFGWIDSGAFRFAFRREYIGLDALGRPGNFAAHILVGPCAEMPARQILGLYSSASWWSGSELPRSQSEQLLPTISLDEMHAASLPRGTGANTADVLSLLLSRNERLALAMHSDDLVAAVYAATERIPEFAETFSFSAYESGDSAAWFEVCGSGDRTVTRSVALGDADPPAPPTEVRRAAELIANPDQWADRAVRDAWNASSRTGQGNRTEFVRICAAMFGVSKGDRCDAADLLPALAGTETAIAILDYAIARRCLAAAIINGDMAIQRSLEAIAAELPGETAAALGQEIANLCSWSDAGNARLVSRLRPLGPHVVHAYGRAALTVAAQDPTSVGVWPVDVLATALHAAEFSQPSKEVLQLLTATATAFADRFASDAALSELWRAHLIVQALAKGQLQPNQLARILSHNVGIAGPVLFGLTPQMRDTIFDSVSVDDGRTILLAVQEVVEPAAYMRHVARLADQLPAPDRCELLLHTRPLMGQRSPRGWADAASGAIRARIEFDLARPKVKVAIDLLRHLCARSSDTRLETWARILDELAGPVAAYVADPYWGANPLIGSWGDKATPAIERVLTRFTNPEDRAAAARLAVDVCVGNAGEPRDIGRLDRIVMPQTDYDVRGQARAVLVAALRAANRRDYLAGYSALCYVAEVLVQPGYLPQTRVGLSRSELSDPTAQHYASRLASILKEHRQIIEVVHDNGKTYGRAASRWLDSL